MVSDCTFTGARRSRQILAGTIDGLICGLLFGVGFAIGILIPTLHHQEAPEQITRFLIWPMIATLLCLWYARTELRGGTLGQKLARLERVRSDGSKLQERDWWVRHWPSLLFVGYGITLIALSIISSGFFKRDSDYIAWMRFWGTILSVAAGAILISAYAISLKMDDTILIERLRMYRGHGFEVVPVRGS